MELMVALGWASLMLCIGMLLRGKIRFLQNMLVPSSVLAGILGIIFMNVAMTLRIDIGTDNQMFTDIVNQMFTLSFISISLTSNQASENGTKGVLKGAVALGLVWNLLYALTPLIGAAIVSVAGSITEMPSVYGMLVQFAFCQGPGQSAAYGAIFEQYGWENATMVAVTLSAIGFVAAFLIGVPIAKLGIKRGIAKRCGKLDERILKGYLKREEQTEQMVKDTTCNSNIETLAFHFALIGVCYLLAVLIGRCLSYLPGFLGSSMSAMMFMNGMYAAYIVKYLMKKLRLDFLQDNVLQNKITGWTSDYLVVCAFMAISVNVIREWTGIILILSVIITIITGVVCFYFGRRIGGDNDFERTLGLYGTCTGTVPSGVALVRIVDPNFQSSVAVELGASNLVMIGSTPVYLIILAFASGTIEMKWAMVGLIVCVGLYLALLKITKTWGKPTYSWKE